METPTPLGPVTFVAGYAWLALVSRQLERFPGSNVISTLVTMLHHEPDSRLSDDEIERELSIAHGRRHHMLLTGTSAAWQNLRLRTEELEAEYLRRFAADVPDGVEKLADYPVEG